MWTHPGKKLLFMGCEFGQEREWNHDHEPGLAPARRAACTGRAGLVRDLNRLYRATPALHELDCEPPGFEWIDADDAEQSVVCLPPQGPRPGAARSSSVCNFTPVPRYGYRIGVPRAGRTASRSTPTPTSTAAATSATAAMVTAEDVACHGRPAIASV